MVGEGLKIMRGRGLQMVPALFYFLLLTPSIVVLVKYLAADVHAVTHDSLRYVVG